MAWSSYELQHALKKEVHRQRLEIWSECVYRSGSIRNWIFLVKLINSCAACALTLRNGPPLVIGLKILLQSTNVAGLLNVKLTTNLQTILKYSVLTAHVMTQRPFLGKTR